MQIKTEKIRKKANLQIVSCFALFIVPYLGKFGSYIFSNFGKYYYLFIVVLIFLIDLINIMMNEQDKRCFNNITIANSRFLGFIIVNMVYSILSYVFFKNSFNNVFFMIMILYVTLFFAKQKIDDNDIRLMGYLAFFFLIWLLIESLCAERISYLNPNSYALISAFLIYIACAGFSTMKKKYIRRSLIITTIIMGVYLAEIIYMSETQMIGILFFIGLIIVKDFFQKHRHSYSIFIFFIILTACLLPFVCYFLIKEGICDTTIFSDRGLRWVQSIEAIKKAGFFGIATSNPGGHNGFLDLCLKYSFCGGILFIFTLFRLFLLIQKNVLKKTSNYYLNSGILAIILINFSEATFVGLTDAYFILISLAVIIANCNCQRNHYIIGGRYYVKKHSCKKYNI